MSPRGHQKKGSNSFWRPLWSQEGCSPLPASTAWNRRDFLCQLCPERPGGSGGERTRRAAAPQPGARPALPRSGSIHAGPGSYSHSLMSRIQCFSPISHHLVPLCPPPPAPRSFLDIFFLIVLPTHRVFTYYTSTYALYQKRVRFFRPQSRYLPYQ